MQLGYSPTQARHTPLITQAAVITILQKRFEGELAKSKSNEETSEKNGESIPDGAPSSKSSPQTENQISRLRAARRALQSVTLHFKTLRTTLKSVKQSYDAILSLKNFQIHQKYKPKRDLHQAEMELDKQRFTFLQEGHQRICTVEKQCFLLLRHVDKQGAAIKTMTDILKTLESALEDEKDLKAVSQDKRKKLITEMNDFRRQFIQSATTFSPAQGLQTKSESGRQSNVQDVESIFDPIILRNVLETQRQKLSDAQKKLVEFEADYSDVVPLQDFNAVEDILRAEEKRHRMEQTAYDTLYERLQSFRNQVDDIISDRDDYEDIYNELQYKATPKPSWSKIAEYVDNDQWQEIYQRKTTKDLVNAVRELVTGRKSEPPTLVPPDSHRFGGNELFQPYAGPVYVRQLNKREMAVLVNDILSLRYREIQLLKQATLEPAALPYGGQINEIQRFPAFFVEYIQNRFPWPSLREEWMYAFHNAYITNPNHHLASLFINILQNTTDECIFLQFFDEMYRIRDIFIAASKAGGHPQGSLPTSNFVTALREAFGHKSETDVQSLAKAAVPSGVVANWYLIKFANFFDSTDEGFVGLFAEELWRQEENDRNSHVNFILRVLLSELGVSLESAERENDPSGETDVSIQQLIAAITTVSPSLSDEKLACAIRWIFFGESTLPFMPAKGLQLVRYIKDKLRNPTMNADDSDDDEVGDTFLEQALEEFQSTGALDDNDDTDSGSQGKSSKKNQGNIPLKYVVTRLKGSSLVWLK